MTDKQKKILEIALELFANEGFKSTSTNKIAKKAKVSEGLIFRHFKNKQGLLDALMQMAETKFQEIVMHILAESDPKAIIRKTIELPFAISESEYDFWRLQFKLKWETQYNNPQKVKPLLDKLEKAFLDLKYEQPCKEAKAVQLMVDAISCELLKGNLTENEGIKDFLLKKYLL